MEYGINKKIKVVWICHFSNFQVREKLPLSKQLIKNFIKKILRKKIGSNYSDFAPWVTNLIVEFEKFNNIELHIISPHKGLKSITKEFTINRINYHFFKPDLPLIHQNIPSRIIPRFLHRFYFNRFIINRFIKKIKPDIVNLIGAENPYYSISILDINNIPIYLSTQTVYSNPERLKLSGSCDALKCEIERKIHDKILYYGCTGRMHRDLILKNNKNAIVFKMFFPIETPKHIETKKILYDFVCFSQVISQKKGIEDAIEALSIVKKRKNNVILNIVGSCTSVYKSRLLKIIQYHNLTDNIVFTDYFPIHEDLYQHVVQSKFAILPIKLDIISGTILEAILLDLPVITYKTSGTPFLNKNGESILLAEMGDTKMLANNMINLLNSQQLADSLKRNAKRIVDLEFNNVVSARRLVDNYISVLNHYHFQKPIPFEQIFNINEFKLYN